MIDLTTLKQAGKITIDENGEKVIQFPIELWQEFEGNSDDVPHLSGENQQVKQMMEALANWENESGDPEDSEVWWSNFREFLGENRLHLTRINPDSSDAKNL